MAWSDEAHKEFQRMTLGEQSEHLFNLLDTVTEEITRLVSLINENFASHDESLDRLNSGLHMALCNCQECSLGKEIYNLMEDEVPSVTNLDDQDD